MPEKSVEQKPSETAFFAAFHRAIANKEYQDEKLGPDDLAGIFLPPQYRFFIRFKGVRANSREKLNEAFPGLHAYVIARTAYYDGFFKQALENKTPQIVVLGAGYDTRGYRFAGLNIGTKIIELDIQPTQNRKKECLMKARISIPENVTLAPIDFNRESIGEVLTKAGYDSQRETLFLWEGVSYYLERAAVDETLEFVSKSSHKDSSIAFDYTVPVSEETRHQYGVEEFYQSMQKHHGDEGLMFAIDDGDIETFLSQRGLKVVEHLDNHEIESKFLSSEQGVQLGKVCGNFRIVLASPD